MKKYTACLLLCLAWLTPHPIAAEDSATPAAGAAKGAALQIKPADLSLTQKAGYVYVLFDAFPYRDALKLDTPKPEPLEPVLRGLASGPVLSRWPATKLVKVDVVEFSERDDYGAPRWDSIKRLGKFEVRITKHKISVKRLSGPDIVH
jgi:hypothetical protein